MCPSSGDYDGLLENGKNCIMFSDDMADFKEKLDYIKSNETLRKTISENAYNDVISNHTYEKRLEKILLNP